MSGVWRKYMLWMLLAFLIWAYDIESCIEEERLALLNLNSYMKSHVDPMYAEYFRGLDYGEEDKYNCCAWRRVSCNPTTQHVAELDLSSMHVVIEGGEKPWTFNVTVLQPFRQLISLDLSTNVIGGLAEKDGSTRLSTLKNLQSLVLDGYDVTGHIFLSDLSVLKNLTLTSWHLNESTLQGIENLQELQVLDLSANHLGSPIFQRLCQSKNLSELHLQQNHLSGSLPLCLQNMSSLLVLDLSYNQINGWLQDIPFNLLSLRDLSLSNNNLQGQLLPNIFPRLASLEHLDLSDNNFEAKFSLSSFGNLAELQFLDLSRSQLQVEIEDSSWYPSFQLQYLGLQACKLNWSEGTMAKFLSKQNNLSYIDLSDNDLPDSFASWILDNKTLLTELDRESDSATLLLYFRHSLDTLIIAGNNFHNELPGNIGFLFPQLISLNVSRCNLKGSIPASLAHMSQLEALDLSFNNLSGELPRGLLNNTSLQLLQLNDNSLQGEIIPEDMNLPVLFKLKLNNNLFSGAIRDALHNSPALSFLDISNNTVTGSLPGWIANLSQLDTLSVSRNSMQGQIPTEVCKMQYLRYLDLSRNSFTGSIPECSNFYSLISFMFLQHNSFTGGVPSALSNASELIAVDLSYNEFSGGIPLWISNLLGLQVLKLSANNFHGHIPNELCHLQDIAILDLSHNQLSGRLPICFGNMSFGRSNISANYITNMYIQGNVPNVAEQVELLIKNQYLSYTGSVLKLMSALDLSSNKLRGVIPSELGDLQHVHSLNLSHNGLIGSIPRSLSNLKMLESLDLSFNNLSGIIPTELADLTFLEVFNVSYNNLIGRTPETGQFGNFDERSYLGNSGLCLSILNKSCNPVPASALPSPNSTSFEEDEDEGGFYMKDFLWSFGMTSFVAFMTTIVVLAINPQWQESWFNLVKRHLLWWLL